MTTTRDPEIEREALARVQALADAPAPEREARLREVEATQPALAAAMRELIGLLDDADLSSPGSSAEVGPVDEGIGERIGPWRIVSRLGRGGMGDVFLAERADGEYVAEVALKRVWTGFAPLTQRFHRERQLLAGLRHPHIAQLIDGGTTAEGHPWLAMELVGGRGLIEWCDDARLSPRARVSLFLQLCDAVAFAHRNLVVHRDLKPGNVLVDAGGQVKLLDFGIARLLDPDSDGERTQTLALTPAWSAPEQRDGGTVSTTTDIYQLGALLRVLLSGLPPEDGRTGRRMSAALADRARTEPEAVRAAALARDASGEARLRAHLAGNLDDIVLRAMREDPAERYPSVADFSGDLQRWLAHRPLEGARDPWALRARKFVQRHRAAVAVGVLFGAGLLATTALALRSAERERAQREAAQTEVARMYALRDYLQLMFRDSGELAGDSGIPVAEILQHGAARIERQFRNDPAGGQSAALLLADLYMNLGDHRAAAPLVAQVLAWRGIEARPDLQAEAHAKQALILQMGGDGEGASAALARARAIWARDPVRFAAARNESMIVQARLERAAGEHATSVATLRTMIAERRDALGLDDRDLATAVSELCNSLVQANEVDAAETACRDALVRFTHLGMDGSVFALGTRNALAVLYGRNERLADAEVQLRRLVEERARLYGTESVDYGVLLLNLGSVLARQGRPAEAVPLQERAAALFARKAEPGGPQALSAALKLGDSYLALGRLDDAEARYLHVERGLAAREALRAPMGLPLALGRARLSLARGRRADAERAVALAEAAVADSGRAGPQDKAAVATLREQLAALP